MSRERLKPQPGADPDFMGSEVFYSWSHFLIKKPQIWKWARKKANKKIDLKANTMVTIKSSKIVHFHEFPP